MSFDISRHNDPTYKPPEPWSNWDTYAGCWCCKSCGAAAGYRLHNPGCATTSNEPLTDDVLECHLGLGCVECGGIGAVWSIFQEHE